MLERAISRDEVAVSAVSFFELALLQRGSRSVLRRNAAAMRADFLHRRGHEFVVDGEIALRAGDLEALQDPFDRFIAATADVHNACLVTADARILDWKGALRRQDAQQ